jgi:hypothetical protein
MELSAFAHMTGRDVKVIQPGLVYVIEHSAFADPEVPQATSPPATDESQLDSREKRRLKKERMRIDKAKAKADEESHVLAEGTPEPHELGPVYVAYALLCPVHTDLSANTASPDTMTGSTSHQFVTFVAHTLDFLMCKKGLSPAPRRLVLPHRLDHPEL